MGMSSVKAQDYSSQLTLGDISQMNMLNPGYMPTSPFLNLPIPVLGNTNIQISNSFSLADIVVDNRVMLNRIPNNASFRFAVDMDFLNFGFKVAPLDFVTVSVGARTTGSIIYPVGAFDLIQNNSLDRTDPFDIRTNSSASSFVEYVVGYTRTIDKNWSVGTKVKYLSGMASAHTNKSNFKVDKSIDSYTIKGDVDMYIGGYDINSEALNVTSNGGMAVDLGVYYISYDKRWSASASVLDMGYINWKDGSRIKSVDPNQAYLFDGLGSLDDLLDGGSSSILGKITDELLDAVALDTTSYSFKESMPVTIHLGGSYAVDRAGQHTVTGNYLQYIKSNTINDYSLTAGYTYASKNKRFRAITSLIRRRSTPFSIGFGLVASSQKFQFFIMNEINVKGHFAVDRLAGVNFRMGMNILLGQKSIL